MAFYRDDPERLTKVIWYFTDSKQGIPWAHCFGSRNYEMKDQDEPPIGERYSPRPWRGGLPPYPVSKGGLCGTEEQWRDGALTTDPLPGLYPGTSIPRCCAAPPPGGNGGIKWGGQVLMPTVYAGGIAYGGDYSLTYPVAGGIAYGGSMALERPVAGGIAYGGSLALEGPIGGGMAYGGSYSLDRGPPYLLPESNCSCDCECACGPCA